MQRFLAKIIGNVFPSVVKRTETVAETFSTYALFSVPERIDFLSPVIISGWMSCCPTRARDVKDLYRGLKGVDQMQLTRSNYSHS